MGFIILLICYHSAMANHFGEHLTLDGYDGSEALLDNRTLVLECLNELPTKLGMKKLSEPQVCLAEPNDIKDPGGWTGFVVIAESHISLHTFPKRGFLSADVYTCKTGMDTDLIINYFKTKFGLGEVETHFIKRGMKYPPSDVY